MKAIKIISGIIILPIATYFLGPKMPDPVLNAELPVVTENIRNLFHIWRRLKKSNRVTRLKFFGPMILFTLKPSMFCSTCTAFLPVAWKDIR